MRGEKVFLAELRAGDAELLTEWQWDKDFMENISYDTYHPFQAEDWQRMFGDPASEEQYYFTIRKIADDRLVGFVSLTDILFKNRNAVIGIGIPYHDNRAQGFGREAIQLILRFAFNHLGLHKVRLSVHAFNQGAIKLYDSLGFVQEGVNREGVYQDGQWFDQFNYGLLQREWRQMEQG